MMAVFAVVLAGAVPASAADNKLDAEARAKIIAPYLDEDAIAVGHADVRRLSPAMVMKKLGDVAQLTAADLQLNEKLLSNWMERLTKAGGKEIYFVVSLADLQWLKSPAMGFMIVPVEDGADADALAKVLGLAFEVGAKLDGDKAVFGGPRATWERVKNMKAAERPEVAKAFAAAGDTALQVLLVPTADSRRVIEAMVPRLPKEVGGGSSKIFTQGVLWAAAGVDVTPKMSIKAVVQSRDAAAAKAFRGLLEGIVKANADQLRDELPELAQLVTPLIPMVSDDQLTANITEARLAAVLPKLIGRARRAAEQVRSANNLRQLGIAMHVYMDNNKSFPAAASYDKQGKPLLSWRVHLLPHVGESSLYKEFHLDEPWDSEHNQKLIAKIPAIYQSGNRIFTAAGKTRYLAPLGKDTIFPGNKAITIKDITDGTSNTIMLVEVVPARAVVWTKPDDLKIDPKKPLIGLVDKNKQFQVLFADASVRMLPADIDPMKLWALFTRNGGEVVNLQ
jgi:hypothetical protein